MLLGFIQSTVEPGAPIGITLTAGAIAARAAFFDTAYAFGIAHIAKNKGSQRHGYLPQLRQTMRFHGVVDGH